MKMDKIANSGNDEFYTPQYAVKPIIKYIPSNSKIWCPLFEGKTRGEACAYIDKNMNTYKLNTMSSWVLERGYF